MSFYNGQGFWLPVVRALARCSVWTLLLLCSATLAPIGAARAAAIPPACGLTATTATTQSGPAGSSLTFGFSINSFAGGCAGTVSGDIILISNTTGAIVVTPSLPASWSGVAGNVITFTVQLGPNPGASVNIDARMLVGQVGSFAGTVSFTGNTNSVVTYTPATATILGTTQLTGVTIGTNVLRNGAPTTNQTRFDNATAATTIATVTPDASGNAFTNFSSFSVGTYSLTGNLICPISFFDPPCNAASSPINFSVTVEATGVTRVSPATVGTTTTTPVTLTARYGSTNFTAPDGSTLSWSIVSQPTGGNGTVNGAPSTSTTTTAGNTGVSFAATVPGTYVISASSGCTFCSGPVSANFTVNVTLPVVRTLAPSSGNGQSAPTNTALPAPLVVLAQDNGVNASGITINWAVTSGSATLSAPSSVTDVNGLAGVNVTLGATAGPVTITGTRADNAAAIATFTATATLVRTLTVSSGNNQSAPTSTTLPAPLVALARDNGTNAPGVLVNWAVTSGSATLSTPSSVTDVNGLASVSVTLGATPGTVTITGTRADDGTAIATFTATATLVRTLVVSSGNNQTAPTSTTLPSPLVALAKDNGINKSGVIVNWTVTSGSATLSTPSSVTDVNGLAIVSVTFGPTPGTVTITGTRADDGTAIATFTATATLVRTLVVSSGNNQTAPTSTTLPSPLVALAKDNGINKSGVIVNWTVTSGSATLSTPSSVTDVNGLASVNVTFGPTPGTVTVTGRRADDASAVAVFTLTSTLVRTLVISSGNNQTAAPGSTLALPFVVLARNNGNPAFGVGINWTVASGSGSLAPPSSTTNTSGNASSTLTLGAAPGAVTVTASRTDDPTVQVTFTANAAQLAALSGLKPEAAAVARAIDQFCPKLPSTSTDPNVIDLRKRCLEMIGSINIDPAGVGVALDELFADVALVQSESGLLAAQSQFENLKARIAALRSGTRGTSFGGLAINASGGQLPVGAMFQNLLDGNNAAAKEVGADFSRWGFFAAGTLGRGNADPGVVSPGYDFDINGFTVGADYRHSDKLIFGGSLGYTRQNNDLTASEGELKTRGWSASAYGTFFKNDSWYSDAMLSYGRNNYQTERRLHYSFTLPGGATTTVDQLGRGDSSGNSLTLAGSFGRDFNKNGWGFGPYFRALYTRLDFDPLTEHLISGAPGSGLALAIDTRNVTSLTSTLGGKLTYAHSTNWGVLIPHLQLEWQHEFRTDPSAVEAHFLYDPTATPFTITGDAVDSDFFRFGVGMSFVMTHGRSGFFYYEKLLSRERFSQDSLAIGLRLEF